MNQLEGMIEIPEVLDFACNDRSQLMDQLKVLQMVLKKERDKNKNNSMPITSDQSSTNIQSTIASDATENLKEKVEKHKQIVMQRRQDKLKQMDAEAGALSRALANEECGSSKDTKVKKIVKKRL